MTIWPSLLRDQERQEHSVAAHHRHQVDIDHPLPFLDRQRVRNAARQDPDIVHHDVDPPKRGQRRIAQLFERVFGDIERKEGGFAALGLDFGHGSRAARRVDIGDQDRNAPSGQRQCRAASYAVCTAGDDGGPAFQSIHRLPLSCSSSRSSARIGSAAGTPTCGARHRSPGSRPARCRPPSRRRYKPDPWRWS